MGLRKQKLELWAHQGEEPWIAPQAASSGPREVAPRSMEEPETTSWSASLKQNFASDQPILTAPQKQK